MSDLLRAVAALPQIRGGLSVGPFGDQGRGGFWLARTDAGPEVAVAVVAGAGAEGYARLLSGAPAMLDLLATAMLCWGEVVQEDSKIDGDDAAERLAGFTTEVRAVLQAMVGPLAPGKDAMRRDLGVTALNQFRPHPANGSTGPDDAPCRECGRPVFITSAGISHHVGDGPDGIDYGRDRDHVAMADIAVSP